MQPYIVRSQTEKSGNEEKEVFYGIPVTTHRVTEEDIAREICERSSLTEEDVLAALGAAARLVREHLSDGSTVSLKGFGVFSVSGSSEPCATAAECTPAKMKARRICFKADGFMRSILSTIKYRRVENKFKK